MKMKGAGFHVENSANKSIRPVNGALSRKEQGGCKIAKVWKIKSLYNQLITFCSMGGPSDSTSCYGVIWATCEPKFTIPASTATRLIRCQNGFSGNRLSGSS